MLGFLGVRFRCYTVSAGAPVQLVRTVASLSRTVATPGHAEHTGCSIKACTVTPSYVPCAARGVCDLWLGVRLLNAPINEMWCTHLLSALNAPA